MPDPQHDTADHANAHRYDAAMADKIEANWQNYWEQEGTFHTPNPTGDLSVGAHELSDQPKFFVMDMFPYPSGAGLHVGHPLGYIGTDVYARYKRMSGFNVVHTMGYDAFGLPAEEYARATGQHPRITTDNNIEIMGRQLKALGLGHDSRRSIATTDESFYRWTQWIFLQIFNSWYDEDLDKARPIAELIAEFEAGTRQPSQDDERDWQELSPTEQRKALEGYRLAHLTEAPVNWCPELGTVLSNEEVTAEGRSERGNHPVFRRPLKQWMLRITKYADRLLDDLEGLDWPTPVKTMQRNWIGKSIGATVSFAVDDNSIEVFTTRPDTLFGTTYMVLAPEHPLVDELAPQSWPDGTADSWTGGAATPAEAIAAYRHQTSTMSDRDRQAENRTKTGVYIGVDAVNPANGEALPVFIADYVLMGYGTGAIMAVPGQDQRDWDFAKVFGLNIVRTVQPSEGFEGEAYTGEGPAINSGFLDGLGIVDAKAKIIDWLVAEESGDATVTYKLRDWLFSRQRYWGEPFPIVFGDDGLPLAVPDDQLPVLLPEVADYAPRPATSPDAPPEPPLGRATDWLNVEMDLGDGPKAYRRELNTMPNWAGSCWYYLRYLDPTNDEQIIDPAIDAYWMGSGGKLGGVDLYIGGVEHAVLHLLYARFWHKVLFDLGYVCTGEPFQRLINQGYILADAYTDERGIYVPAADVTEDDGDFTFDGAPVTREAGKMGKSLKNSVTPDDIYANYGADTLRLYEMSMGPIDQDRPWETRAIVGSQRLLQRIWRTVVDEATGEPRVTDEAPDDATLREIHRAISATTEDMEGMRFNTAVAEITKLTNHLTKQYPTAPTPRAAAEALTLMLAPLAPHMAEELWDRLGHADTLTYEAFPVADEGLLVEESQKLPVQVMGKLRGHIEVALDATQDEIQAAALADPNVQSHVGDSQIKRVIVVPGRMVNIVV
jgi:leucyl-tRNA synthetase